MQLFKLLKVSILYISFTALVACGGSEYVENADRNDVITIGDSIFDLSGDLQLFLEQKAGQTFRNYTQSGAELTGGIIATAIDVQYSDAKTTNSNINTVVMDGGGNDILIPAMIGDIYGCRTQWYRWDISNRCKNLVDNVYVDLVELLNQMDEDGVQDVIYLGYYELPRGNDNLLNAVNYGDERLGSACLNSTVNCTFVDPRGSIPAEFVLSDNIHPTSEGSQVLADLIWPHLEPLL